ncbi:Na/H antiporter [Candidatus Omnitrophus magneticus]|uniref:Na/H antiporter n=1 Tax=Candidatus Omnitrophus magneticus TaxID=1609969 RepID=A0A0F0CMT9_9BACT|nr:Na/H antiporter [Candidatus Omnitrophus magneticus]
MGFKIEMEIKMRYLSEQNIFIFLIQVFCLLGLARVLGELFRRWKQPPLTAEILVGVFLGPTLLGRFAPSVHNYIFPNDIVQQSMFDTVAWLGVLFLLLEIGLEVDFSSAWKQRGDALKIALTDIIVPMAVCLTACFFIPARYLTNPDQRIIFAFFMAIVMTISAMPTSARALYDLRLSKTDLGFLIMSALSVNDIIGWLIFTIILGFFTQVKVDVLNLIVIVICTFGFSIFCLSIGRKIVDAVISLFKARKMPQPGVPLTFICLLGLACGAITHKIGIHALFGFFLAGIMAGGSKALSEETRSVISQMVYAVFVPLFFVNVGLKVDFLNNFNIVLVLFISLIGIFARFFGAWLGVNLTKISRANRLTIAIAHTPGGSMEIVIGLLALEYNLITEQMYVAIIFAGVISSVILGPWLNYSIRKRREVSVLEFFSRENILPSLKYEDRDRVIMELCERSSKHLETHSTDDIFLAVIKRENIMGTALEEGIAVPHARIPSLRKPLIVFGKSVSGVYWNSPDGKLTRFIFLILTPQEEDDSQVQILASIVKSMSESETRDAISSSSELNEMWNILQKTFAATQITKKKKK